VSGGGDVARATERGDLLWTLQDPIAMKEGVEIVHHIRPPVAGATLAVCVHGLKDLAVEVRIAACAVMEGGRVLEKPLQLGIEFSNGVGAVRSKVALRAFDPGSGAIPDGSFGVPGANKEDEGPSRVARREDSDRIRLFKACEVMKIAVLAVVVLYVAVSNLGWLAGDDSDSVTDRVDELSASLGMDVHQGLLLSFD
jgi:hypothetical protein